MAISWGSGKGARVVTLNIVLLGVLRLAEEVLKELIPPTL